MTTGLNNITPISRSSISRRNGPNAETIRAMQEARGIMTGKVRDKAYSSFRELLDEVQAEMEKEDHADDSSHELLQG